MSAHEYRVELSEDRSATPWRALVRTGRVVSGGPIGALSVVPWTASTAIEACRRTTAAPGSELRILRRREASPWSTRGADEGWQPYRHYKVESDGAVRRVDR